MIDDLVCCEMQLHVCMREAISLFHHRICIWVRQAASGTEVVTGVPTRRGGVASVCAGAAAVPRMAS